MASNNIKLFDENKTNMLSDSEYSTNTQRVNGVQSGIASSKLNNKAMYQVSLVAYAIGQLMAANGKDANDADAVSTFVANMDATMVQKVKDIASSEEAKAGINTSHYMTPYTTKVAIEEFYNKSIKPEISSLYKIGDIKQTVSSNIPENWLRCNGAKIDKEQYSELWNMTKETITNFDNYLSITVTSNFQETFQRSYKYFYFNEHNVSIVFYNGRIQYIYSNDNFAHYTRSELITTIIPTNILSVYATNFVIYKNYASCILVYQEQSTRNYIYSEFRIYNDWTYKNISIGNKSYEFIVNNYVYKDRVGSYSLVANAKSDVSGIAQILYTLYKQENSDIIELHNTGIEIPSQSESKIRIQNGIFTYEDGFYFTLSTVDFYTDPKIQVYRSETVNGRYTLIKTLNRNDIIDGSGVLSNNARVFTLLDQQIEIEDENIKNLLYIYYEAGGKPYMFGLNLVTNEKTYVYNPKYINNLVKDPWNHLTYKNGVFYSLRTISDTYKLYAYENKESSQVLYDLGFLVRPNTSGTKLSINNGMSCLYAYSNVSGSSNLIFASFQIVFSKNLPMIPEEQINNNYYALIKAKEDTV